MPRTDLVSIRHPETGATEQVTEKLAARYLANGWVRDEDAPRWTSASTVPAEPDETTEATDASEPKE